MPTPKQESETLQEINKYLSDIPFAAEHLGRCMVAVDAAQEDLRLAHIRVKNAVNTSVILASKLATELPNE